MTMTPWDALSVAVTKLADKIAQVVEVREATIDAVNPVSVLFDTDDTSMPAYSSLEGHIAVGDRVLTLKLRHYVWVLGKKGGDSRSPYGSYSGTVKFETVGNSTFSKADYPGLRAVRVRLVGAGGSGGDSGGASTGQHSAGGGGGGGGYAESFIEANALPSSVTVTVGRGGRDIGGFNGEAGLPSSFGSLVAASGGGGGTYFSSNALMIGAEGGAGGEGTAGDIRISGSPGGMGSGYATLGHGGVGGSSQLGGGGLAHYTGAGSGNTTGEAGGKYGGGGAGGTSNAGGSKGAGGNGAHGVVLVDLYM